MSARKIGFLLGVFAFLALLVLPVPSSFVQTAQKLVEQSHADIAPEVLALSMQHVLAVLLLMVAWWLTEAVPLPATALVPIVLFPLLQITGVHHGQVVPFTLRNTALNYANPVIFLFLGGFLLAAAMQKWKLDRRMTLWLLTRGSLANDSRSILLGMMIMTAFLSMWISNTATAAMMLPLGLGVLTLLGAKPGESRYGTAVMLGIAWAASIGGIGTIIGTPPNGIALGILNTALGDTPGFRQITFLDWMLFAVPLVLLLIPLAWLIVLRANPPEMKVLPGGRERMQQERSTLGPLGNGERRTIVVFALAVLCWVTNPFWDSIFPAWIANHLSWVNEYVIGIVFGTLLFFVPVRLRAGEFILDWRDTKFVDWGTLILFGGGIALSDGMFKSGLASVMATSFLSVLGTPSTLVMMIGVVLFMVLLTEVTSNTAVTSMMVPIIISISLRAGEDPTVLSIAAALGASLAFLLPVATPPNALVYSTGFVRIHDMIRSGILLELIGWACALLCLVVFGGWVFGILPL